MIKSKDDLLTEKEVIRTETVKNANTVNRLGLMFGNIIDTLFYLYDSLSQALSNKQDTLNNTNLKTVGGQSLLGSGDIALPSGSTDITGKADKDLAINTEGASYTLRIGDRAGMVRMSVATANTITFPPDSEVNFPIGTQIIGQQAGAGQTTHVPGAGVTLINYGNKFKSIGQYAGFTYIKVAPNTWTILGELSA